MWKPQLERIFNAERLLQKTEGIKPDLTSTCNLLSVFLFLHVKQLQ